MDAWAASYGSSVAFICVSCAGPQLATQFGNELMLKNCYNTWADEDDMPSWGQLGCNGLIVIDGADSVVCQASPAYLEVKNAAFRHVETLLDALLRSKPAPKMMSGRVDPSIGGHCAEVRFGADNIDVVEEVLIVTGLSSRPELNGKRARVLSSGANGRVAVEIDGEVAPLSIKRQNLTAVADGEASSGVASNTVVDPQSINVPSVKVAVLDEEHEKCERKLGLLDRLTTPPGVSSKRGQIDGALRGLLSAYEEHFAHEETLLDKHLYAGIEHEASGFSADKGSRTSHFADHKAMLDSVSKLLEDVSSVSQSDVLKLATDFQRHATAYDGSYADRLSVAMANATPVDVA
uniref:Hemerythrin-like domain-containing protein n=1 Tax=Haptolina brevifila TaxID=156173 RepID=A0A7S2MSZ7_9EUKA|mmetsp:Transcript_58063/g.115261  ORF Transcript_58063/g.115261 Transcript_58063/m.115261 type:complete len:349 (+) Transcript_58063:252-1298(+)